MALGVAVEQSEGVQQVEVCKQGQALLDVLDVAVDLDLLLQRADQVLLLVALHGGLGGGELLRAARVNRVVRKAVGLLGGLESGAAVDILETRAAIHVLEARTAGNAVKTVRIVQGAGQLRRGGDARSAGGGNAAAEALGRGAEVFAVLGIVGGAAGGGVTQAADRAAEGALHRAVQRTLERTAADLDAAVGLEGEDQLDELGVGDAVVVVGVGNADEGIDLVFGEDLGALAHEVVDAGGLLMFEE